MESPSKTTQSASLANLKRYPKGSNGNPSGLTHLTKRAADKTLLKSIKELCPQAIATLVDCLGSNRGDVRVKAAGMILAYALGKPRQSIRIEGSITLEQILSQSIAKRAAVEPAAGGKVIEAEATTKPNDPAPCGDGDDSSPPCAQPDGDA